MSAENIDMGLNSRTNEFLCFLKVSPSIIVVMPEMLMCNRHLLPAGTISRAVSPGAGALLLCTWPVAGKKGKEIALRSPESYCSGSEPCTKAHVSGCLSWFQLG